MLPKLRIVIILVSLAFACTATAQTTGGTRSTGEPKQETIEARVEKYLRNLYAWGPSFDVKVGPAKPSPIPDLLQVPVTVSMQGQSDTAIVYVTKEGAFIMRGELSDMKADPLADVRSKLHPGNSPSIGPENAKITIIEFADFECPSCRQMDLILRDFMSSHPEVRLVYKNFPLTDLHPWAMTAAIASQCTYDQNPAAFWKIHDAIFDAQEVIGPSNAWDKMIDLATKIGLDKDAFQACMINPETKHQIEETMEEGRTLNITATPTTFVDGRRIVGPDKTLLDQFASYFLL